MYRGTGAPAFVRYEGESGNVLYILPKPKRGGRTERYVPLMKIYENIDGEKIPGERKFRFEGEYEFGSLSSQTIESILAIYNNRTVVKWIPHSDMTVIAYNSIITELNPMSLNGIIAVGTLRMKIISTHPTNKIPAPDNMFGAFMLTRISNDKKNPLGG